MKHGDRVTYAIHKCRCNLCRRAAARYEQERLLDRMKGQPRRLDNIGTKRRLQALCALGWSFPRQAAYLGVNLALVQRWGTTQPYVARDTALKVAAMYADLSMRLPEPATRNEAVSVGMTRKYAERMGFAPPLAWDEEVIDDPNATPVVGRSSQLYSVAELVAEWDFLRQAGYSIELAARKLGVTVDAIQVAVRRESRVVERDSRVA